MPKIFNSNKFPGVATTFWSLLSLASVRQLPFRMPQHFSDSWPENSLSLCLCHVRTQQEGSCLLTWKRYFTRHELPCTLIWDSACRTVKNKCLLLKPHNLSWSVIAVQTKSQWPEGFSRYNRDSLANKVNFLVNQKTDFCPAWYGSVDWAMACKPKGRWFDSQSGHVPGLQARSPAVGVQEASTHCFLLLFPSLYK